MTDDIRPCRCGHVIEDHAHRFDDTVTWCGAGGCLCQQFEEDGDG